MTKKQELADCIEGLVNYIYINKELDSIKGASLDYVLIVLNKLKRQIEDIKEMEIEDVDI